MKKLIILRVLLLSLFLLSIKLFIRSKLVISDQFASIMGRRPSYWDGMGPLKV